MRFFAISPVRFTLTVLTALVLAALAGCSSISVNYDYDDSVDFQKFSSYSWLEKPATVPANAQQALSSSDLLDQRIRKAVDSEMAARNLTHDENAPQLLVIYHIGMQDKIQVTDWGYRYADYYWGYGGRQIDVYQFTEGSVIVDVIEAETKGLIWRGTGTGVVDTTQKSPEELQARVNKVIGKIMASFPPQGK